MGALTIRRNANMENHGLAAPREEALCPIGAEAAALCVRLRSLVPGFGGVRGRRISGQAQEENPLFDRHAT